MTNSLYLKNIKTEVVFTKTEMTYSLCEVY